MREFLFFCFFFPILISATRPPSYVRSKVSRLGIEKEQKTNWVRYVITPPPILYDNARVCVLRPCRTALRICAKVTAICTGDCRRKEIQASFSARPKSVSTRPRSSSLVLATFRRYHVPPLNVHRRNHQQQQKKTKKDEEKRKFPRVLLHFVTFFRASMFCFPFRLCYRCSRRTKTPRIKRASFSQVQKGVLHSFRAKATFRGKK